MINCTQLHSHSHVHRFYTLAVMPEAQADLREEVRAVLAETGGEYKNTSAQNMKKLDSFIREGMRYYPIGSCECAGEDLSVRRSDTNTRSAVFHRKTLKPITFSDGTVLPQGVIVQTALSALSKDPSIFNDPETFDYLRFYKQRQAASAKGSEASAKGQMVGVAVDNLNFGLGRHACPGKTSRSMTSVRPLLINHGG